nr:MAG TPA: Portal protein [Caudoviricetes sp.]
MADKMQDFADKLERDISTSVGNMVDDELSSISDNFDAALTKALQKFSSNSFDNDGFIRRIQDLDVDKKDKDTVKNILNTIKNEYIDTSVLNQREILLRRDMYNVCTQMPEMRDVVWVTRDSIIEANVSTGEVSRSLIFRNNNDSERNLSQVRDLETKHDLLMAAKNFVVPKTLMMGENYVQITPFSKIFAEIQAVKERKQNKYGSRQFKENTEHSYYMESTSLYSESNLKIIMESVSTMSKVDSKDIHEIGDPTSGKTNIDAQAKADVKHILENIRVCRSDSVILEEYGIEAVEAFMKSEYQQVKPSLPVSKDTHFAEAMGSRVSGSIFSDIQDTDLDIKSFEHIKGCYIKYLDGLRVVPIRMDRRVIGYYYITTTLDLAVNPSQPQGIVDLSYQNYVRDKNMVDNLAALIIKSFDKNMLQKNVKLKQEIADVIMAHKFSEGMLSFVYIPENEIVRFVINEDETGRGHGMLEPAMFPARNYLMLNLYNILFTLNNTTTRVHYLRSSGMNKDYAAQIQRTMRKFQSRRITVDDIYSYQGVLNKVGGMGEMVLPAGRGDYKALETDTIEAVNKPIDIELLEQQRRQAIAGTGAPHLMVINALDEVDFAKTLEMANSRFLSTVSAYKIDFNKGFTEMYRRIMRYSTDIEEDVIQSFIFKFNAAKQQELNITADMINNFNQAVEVIESIQYGKDELEDKDGKPTFKRIVLRKELAKKYLPQLDFDELEEIFKRVDAESTDMELQQRVNSIEIDEDELKEAE